MHTMYDMQTDLIGTAEAMRILGVSQVTVTRWAASGTLAIAGKLPSKNGAFLFEREAVEALRDQLAAAVSR